MYKQQSKVPAVCSPTQQKRKFGDDYTVRGGLDHPKQKQFKDGVGRFDSKSRHCRKTDVPADKVRCMPMNRDQYLVQKKLRAQKERAQQEFAQQEFARQSDIVDDGAFEIGL